MFGKNTTAGALNITTKAPSFTAGGSAELDAGDYNTYDFKGSFTGSIVDDVLAGRISFVTDNHSGFIRNVISGVSQQDYHRRFRARTVALHPGLRPHHTGDGDNTA